jgi:SAM-dependent methyltransferase
MGITKFSEVKNYLERYVENDEEFYSTVKEQLGKIVDGDNQRGLDVGAGPGVTAILLSQLGKRTLLHGCEPSDTYEESEELSRKLVSKEFLARTESQINYSPVRATLEFFLRITLDVYDYMVFLRSAHEIADSMGGKDQFFEVVEQAFQKLKKGGKVLFADPQYTKQIRNNPRRYEELISLVQEYQDEHIGHHHVPSDYINNEELKERLGTTGLILTQEIIIPDTKTLSFLKDKGFDINKPPTEFYVQTYQKL